MFAVYVSAVVFVCALLAGFAGMALRPRLPEHHLSEESKDIVKTMIAVVATLTALVLGLLVASAKSSLDAKLEGLRHLAALTVLLDRTLAQYGPEASGTRTLLADIVDLRIKQLWSGDIYGPASIRRAVSGGPNIETIQRQLLSLSPRDATQSWYRNSALDISKEIATERWEGLQVIGSRVQLPFLGVLTLWIMVLFLSSGVFAPTNLIVTVTMVVCAASVAAAMFLVLEMDQPFRGLIKISSEPLVTARQIMGQP